MKKLTDIITSPKFIKFFISGVTAFVVDTALLYVFRNAFFGGEPKLYDVILFDFGVDKFMAASVAVVVSFVMNRYWAFEAAAGSLTKQASKFLGVFALNAVVAAAVFPAYEWLIEKITGETRLVFTILRDSDQVLHMDINPVPTFANVATVATIMVISYFFYSKFVFNDTKEPNEPTDSDVEPDDLSELH